MLHTVFSRFRKQSSATAVAKERVHLGIVLPERRLHLVATEAFAEVPMCNADQKPGDAAWRQLKKVVRGPLFSDEVLACRFNNDTYRFVAGVGVVHLNDVVRYDESLLIPVETIRDSCDHEVALAILTMEKLLEQFAEAHGW